jgi:predicted transcriptional regulator
MTYAQLLTAVARWLDRNDLSSDIPTFVQLGHASLVRMLAGAPALTDPAGGNWLLSANPDVYLYAALVESAPFLKDDDRVALWRAELDRRVAEVLRSRNTTTIDATTRAGLRAAVIAYLDRADLVSAVPVFIQQAHASLTRLLSGAPTLSALSNDASTNWLLTGHSDLYVYATLVESAPFLQDDERVPLWRSELERRVAEVLRVRTETALNLTTYEGLVAGVAAYLDRRDLTGSLPTFIKQAHASLARVLAGATPFAAPAPGVSSWMLTEHSDVYLYAALVEAAPYLGQDERVQLWRSELAERVEGVRRVRSAVLTDITTYDGLLAGVASYLDRRDLVGSLPTFVKQAHTSLRRVLAGVTPFAMPSSGVTNWLLTDHSDVYLYAALVEAAPYLGDDARLAVWRSELAERIEGVRRVRSETTLNLTTYEGLIAGVASYLDRRDLVGSLPTFVTQAHAGLTRALAGVTPFAVPGPGVTNWLLTEHPDVYLYAALVESAPYLGDDARLTLWRSELDGRIEGVRRARNATPLDLTSYYGLLSAVESYLDRRDLVAALPMFVALAGASLSRWVAEWGGDELAPLAQGSNWLFASSPDVYLYAALLEAAPYVGEDPRLAVWQAELIERQAKIQTFMPASEFSMPMRRTVSAIG